MQQDVFSVDLCMDAGIRGVDGAAASPEMRHYKNHHLMKKKKCDADSQK